ncbi:MAG: hypothetical protein J6L62_06210 [Clostridia bacterium]|nr:hypothetical protein [Clostridia bacterium]
MTYNFDDYLNTVRQNIKNKKLHATICAELESHLQDSADFYVEIGYDEETANKKALEDMGEPATVGENMAKLHKLSVGQTLIEVLFCLFVIIKICETIFYSIANSIFPLTYIFAEEFVIMLFVCFGGFTLSLRHKRLLPAVMSALYVVSGVFSTAGVFYVMISQLSGQWEMFLTAMELDAYPLNLNDKIKILSMTLSAIVTMFLIFMCARVRKQIYSSSVNTMKFKRIFYRISIPFLAILLTLTVATKTYLHQIDIKEKAEFDKVLSDLCDYCLEKETLTKDDIQQLVEHFDYLEFKEYDNTVNIFSDSNYCDYYISASIGGKSLAHPHVSISTRTDGRFIITAEYSSLYNYQSYVPILLLKVPFSDSVFGKKLSSENVFENVEMWDDASEFTDVIKKYSLDFEYTYYSNKDIVEYSTHIGTQGHPNYGYSWVSVESGKITEAAIINEGEYMLP